MNRYKHLSDEENRWIADNCLRYRNNVSEMTEEFNSLFGRNVSYGGMCRNINANGLMTRCYTDEQVEWLRERWHVNRKDLTRMFNDAFCEKRTVEAIECKMQDLGLIKDKNVSIGRKGVKQ